MKSILFIFFSLLGFGSFSQITVVEPTIYYFSDWQLDVTREFYPGRNIVFRQYCNPEVPTDIVNGTVFLENVNHGKEQFSMSIEFKDTIVTAITYHLDADQTEILDAIGYAEINAHATARKGEWTAVPDETTVMVGDRKKITVICTAK